MRTALALVCVLMLAITLTVGCQSSPPTSQAPAPSTSQAPTSSKPATTSAAAVAPTPKPIIWQLPGINPISSPEGQLMVEMAQVLKQRTNGTFTIEYHDKSEFGYQGPEVKDLIAAGTINIADTVGGYSSGQEPILGITELPFMWAPEKIAVSLDAARPYFDTVWTRQKAKLLMNGAFPNVIWSTKPIKTEADVKALKFRSSSGGVINAMKKLGSAIVTISVGDVYMSMSTGVLDVNGAAVKSGIDTRSYEVAGYCYYAPILNTSSIHMIASQKAFDALPKETQQILVNTAREFQPKLIQNYMASDADIKFLKDKGMKAVEPLNPDLVKWIVENGAKPIWKEWADKNAEVKASMDAVFKAAGLSW